MKTKKILLIGCIVTIIAACGTSKKITTSTPTASTPEPAPAPTTNTTNDKAPFPFVLVADGVHAPGNEELIAIQTQYNDVTMDKLKEGHTLYTTGACVNCHGSANIYQFGEAQWKIIIDDMAKRAAISDEQKDAVYKYVLAIKATQSK